MKRSMVILACTLMLAGCGGGGNKDLETKNADLTRRVKNLEDELLAVQKRMIAHEQAMQTIRSQQREMENYFNKVQAGQDATRRW